MEYIRSIGDEEAEGRCFLCDYWGSPEKDAENHILWRTDDAFVVMNRFPYTGGHLLVALAEHEGDLEALSDNQLSAMGRGIRDSVRVLRAAIQPQGFNIGYNIGQCAGAGLPDHLHAHVVPRWAGDTNFMSVVGEARVIPEALEVTYTAILRAAEESGFVQ